MSTSRLFHQNLVTQSTFSAFNVSGGAVAMADPTGAVFYPYKAGAATLETQGTYTGVFELNYVVEIQSSSSGTFATTLWRWSDHGGPPWNAEDIIPVSGSWVTLNNGIQIRFVSGSGSPQFIAGDFWLGRPLRGFGIVKALDGSRNTEYRSGTLPTSSTLRIGWDLGSAKQPELIVLDDHNLPSNASVSLRAHATTIFSGSPSHNQTITWAANRMAALISSSGFRYWWVNIVMGATALDYLRISELGLWTGVTFDLPPTIGASDNIQWLSTIDVANHASRGPIPRIYSAAQQQYTWSHRKRGTNEDGGRLEAARAYVEAHGSFTMPPFYFLLYDDDLSSLQLTNWAGDLQRQHEFLEHWTYTTQWSAVIRTVAS